jgi:ABC-type polysaccharide/polyol phosphate export permease
LLQIALYTLVFSQIIGIRFREVAGDSSLNYGLYLYCGLLPFWAFNDAVSRSINSIKSNTGLVQRVVFPLEILPLTTSITLLMDKLFGLGMLIVVVAVMVQRLEWTILLLPLVMVVQLLFTMGVSYLFAVIGTYMPDIRETLRSFTRVLFFITPIVWPPERIPESARFLVTYNPLAVLVGAYRDLVLEGRIPDLHSALWFSIFSVVLCIVGLTIFVRVKHNFADLL